MGLRTRTRRVRTALVVLTALGATVAALLAASPAQADTPPLSADLASIDFGTVPIDTTVVRFVTFTVAPGYRVSAAGGTASQPPFAADPGDCHGLVNDGTDPVTCTLTESFEPTMVGAFSGVFELSVCPRDGCASPADAVSVDIPVSGADPSRLAADPAVVDFGDVPPGTTASQPVIVDVDAGYRLSRYRLTTAADGPITVPAPPCFGATGPVSCTFTALFSPTTVGPQSSTVTFFECLVADATNCPSVEVPVTGTGGTRLAAPSPAGLAFPLTGVGFSSAVQTLTISNPGTLPLHVGTLATSADFGLSADGCSGTVVAPGGGCTVGVTFVPTSGGSRTGTVTIPDDAANGPQTVPLSGPALVATAALTPAALSFPARTQGTTSPAQIVTVVDTSTVPMRLSSLATSGDFAVAPGGTCAPAGVVPAGGFCTVAVTFQPTGTGPRQGALVVGDTSGTTPHVVALSGSGTAPKAAGFSVNPGRLAFGQQRVGTTSAARTVVVTNTGTGPLSFGRISVTGNFVRSGGTCSTTTTVPAGHTCTVLMKFAPRGTGARTGALSFADNAAGSPQTVALSGTGLAARAG